MNKKAIITDRAPAAIGPYSQAVISGGLLFLSGQLPMDPATGKISKGSIGDKGHIVFKNLKDISSAAGTALHSAVKTTVFLADIADFQAVNRLRPVLQTTQSRPSTFQVAARPLGAKIEVEAILEL